jgi:hypothetical protein
MVRISRDTAQKFILSTQALRPAKSGKTVMNVIRKIHNIQIDTISVVARSHDLILHNRVDGYKEGNVWKYLKKGRLFEYWSHGMCLIPIEQYPFYAWRMKRYRERKKGWLKKWAVENKQIIDDVYSHIKRNGATPSKNLGKRESKGGGWWDWKAEKYALEYLFYCGNLMVSYREGFQKYYDLTERVLPASVNSEPMLLDKIPDFTVTTTLSSLGLASALDIKLYLGRNACPQWHGRISNIEKHLDGLVQENKIEEIAINGVEQRYFALQKNIKRLIKEDENNYENQPALFLSPFDNIIRERHQPLALWNFEYKLESYTQANKRQYGYYVLPILDNNQLVGRMDSKVHRKSAIFEIKSLYLENDFIKNEKPLNRLIIGLASFTKFHDCNSIKLGKVTPKKMQPILDSHISSLF